MTKHDGQQAVFGPVPSRRLGLSLGVDLVYPKTCPLDCIYCELGPTTLHTTRRAIYRDADQVLTQVAQRLTELAAPPDYITLAGSGEPTLHLELGKVIAGLKELKAAPVAVLTNGVLLSDPSVRAELALADVVIPSLDAADQAVFRRVNRPAPGLEIHNVIQGLKDFSAQFNGHLWLEVLLVAGVNDSPAHLATLARAAREIGPELVQLNTVIRPPAVAGAGPLSQEQLEAVAANLGLPCVISAPPTAHAGADRGQAGPQVVEMTRRRPCTSEDVAAAVGLGLEEAERLLHELAREGKLKREEHGGMVFFRGV